MADFKISLENILKIIALIIELIQSGMSEKAAVGKAAAVNGISFSKTMNIWKKYKR